MVMCERPVHLTPEEATAWLKREAGELVGADDIESVELTALENTPLRWGRIWDWLIEIEFAEGSDVVALAQGSRCAALLADLRLLGMRPAIAVADPAKKQTLSPAR